MSRVGVTSYQVDSWYCRETRLRLLAILSSVSARYTNAGLSLFQFGDSAGILVLGDTLQGDAERSRCSPELL